MMDVTKTTQELVNKVEDKVEKGLEVVKDTFHNVASHLPLANLAKHKNDTFTIEVDLPGVKKEDIELKVEDDYLTVTALRRYKNEVKEDDYYLCESNFGVISRSFVLSDNIDRDKIHAKFEDGRLYLTLEKVASKKTKSIAIK
jgi:HSP20 family protein